MTQPTSKETDGSVLGSVKKTLVSHDSSLSTGSLETDNVAAQHRQRSPPDHTVTMPDVPYSEVSRPLLLHNILYTILGSLTSALNLSKTSFADFDVFLFVACAQLPDEHQHYSGRAPWLRAGVLGANDGLVSVVSLMLGVEGGTNELHSVILAGVAGLVAGALSMAVGEFVSVSSQRYKSCAASGCIITLPSL